MCWQQTPSGFLCLCSTAHIIFHASAKVIHHSKMKNVSFKVKWEQNKSRASNFISAQSVQDVLQINGTQCYLKLWFLFYVENVSSTMRDIPSCFQFLLCLVQGFTYWTLLCVKNVGFFPRELYFFPSFLHNLFQLLQGKEDISHTSFFKALLALVAFI